MEEEKVRVLCRLPCTKTLQELCDLAFQILGNPVFVHDMAMTVLAYSNCTEIGDPFWHESVIGNRLAPNTLSEAQETNRAHFSSVGKRRPVLIPDQFSPYPRLVKTVLNEGHPVAVFVITAYMKPFTPEDYELVELITAFVHGRLTQDHYYISDDKRTVENYFIKLLDGMPAEAEQITAHLGKLGYRWKPFTYVLALFRRGRGKEQAHMDLEQLLAELRRSGDCRAFFHRSVLLCVYGSDEEMTDWRAQAPELSALLEHEGLTAGVSQRVKRIERLREYAAQAGNALDIATRLDRPDSFYAYDLLSSFKLFQDVPPDALAGFCHEKILELNEYDKAHGTEFCVTLQVYLEQLKRLTKTAELLYIHRNTVSYRIKRCMELMKTDMEDGNEIFAYILSLRILEYQKKIMHKNEESKLL